MKDRRMHLSAPSIVPVEESIRAARHAAGLCRELCRRALEAAQASSRSQRIASSLGGRTGVGPSPMVASTGIRSPRGPACPIVGSGGLRCVLSALGIAVVACAALLVTGCARPREDVVAVRHVLEDGTRGPDLPVDGTLTLTQAVALANVGSETIAIQGEQFVRAVTQKHRAVSAFLPTVDLNPSWSVRKGGGGGGSVLGGNGDPVVVPGSQNGSSTAYDANLDIPIDLDLVVFDGLRNVNGYWRDVYLVERQRELLLEAQEQLLADVAQTYYAVLRSEAQVRVLENSLNVQEERLRTTQGQQRAGTARPLDVAQTQAQVSATRVSLIEARRAVQDGRSLLQYLVNAPVESSTLTDAFAPEGTPAVDAALAVAASRRSELAASYRAVQAARRDVEVASGAYWPSVSVNLSAFLYRETAPDARTWEALLGVSVPIFSAGRIEADVRTAWSFLREALLVDAQTRRRVRREVEQNVRDLVAGEARLNELQVQLSAAREAYRQADASYGAGLGTNLERVVAQDAQLQAELAFVTEQIDQKLLRLALLRSIGTLRETLLDVPTEDPTTRPVTRPTTGPAR